VETMLLSDAGAGGDAEAEVETEEAEGTELEELLTVTVFSDIYTVF
jgi:hypothetical protein